MRDVIKRQCIFSARHYVGAVCMGVVGMALMVWLFISALRTPI
jgi:hypothetical protein